MTGIFNFELGLTTDSDGLAVPNFNPTMDPSTNSNDNFIMASTNFVPDLQVMPTELPEFPEFVTNLITEQPAISADMFETTADFDFLGDGAITTDSIGQEFQFGPTAPDSSTDLNMFPEITTDQQNLVFPDNLEMTTETNNFVNFPEQTTNGNDKFLGFMDQTTGGFDMNLLAGEIDTTPSNNGMQMVSF